MVGRLRLCSEHATVGKLAPIISSSVMGITMLYRKDEKVGATGSFFCRGADGAFLELNDPANG